MRKNFSSREINAMRILRNTCTVAQIAEAFGTSVNSVVYHTNDSYRAKKNEYDTIYNKGRTAALKKIKNINS